VKQSRPLRRIRRWPLVLTVALLLFVVYASQQPAQAARTVTTAARHTAHIAHGLAAFARQL
jgi:hypothetical protein